MLFDLCRPLLFTIDPERAHQLTIAALKVMPRARIRDDPILATTVGGLHLPSPIGLAAGFDKNAEVPVAMLALGFGSVEVGTLTPRAQAGNPRPRVFRLVADAGVINRLGFNNGGHQAAVARLSRACAGIVGVNIGANKDAVDRIADYAAGVRTFAPLADYLCINVSSPNTPGLRGLQLGHELTDLLTAVAAARTERGPPVWLKIAPDLDDEAIAHAVEAAIAHGIDALVVGNTTLVRDGLRSAARDEAGGLSGKPLADRALDRLRVAAAASRGRLPIVAVGGIDSGAAAYARIRAGAASVQLYTALVYHGPGLVRRMADELAALLRRDGYTSVAQATGVDAR